MPSVEHQRVVFLELISLIQLELTLNLLEDDTDSDVEMGVLSVNSLNYILWAKKS